MTEIQRIQLPPITGLRPGQLIDVRLPPWPGALLAIGGQINGGLKNAAYTEPIPTEPTMCPYGPLGLLDTATAALASAEVQLMETTSLGMLYRRDTHILRGRPLPLYVDPDVLDGSSEAGGFGFGYLIPFTLQPQSAQHSRTGIAYDRHSDPTLYLRMPTEYGDLECLEIGPEYEGMELEIVLYVAADATPGGFVSYGQLPHTVQSYDPIQRYPTLDSRLPGETIGSVCLTHLACDDAGLVQDLIREYELWDRAARWETGTIGSAQVDAASKYGVSYHDANDPSDPLYLISPPHRGFVILDFDKHDRYSGSSTGTRVLLAPDVDTALAIIDTAAHPLQICWVRYIPYSLEG